MNKSLEAKHPNFKIDYHLKDCSGVYMIILGNTVYIGSTVNFYRRYMQHKSKWNTYPTKELMDNGAAFHLLWLYLESEHIDYNDFTYDDVIEDTKQNIKIEIIRKKEIEYIKECAMNQNILLINSDHANLGKVKVAKVKLCPIYVDEFDVNQAVRLLENNNIEYTLKK